MKLCESGLSVLSLVENHPVDVQIQTMNNCSKRSVGKASDSFALSLGKRTRFLGGTVATVCLGCTKEVLCPDPLPGSWFPLPVPASSSAAGLQTWVRWLRRAPSHTHCPICAQVLCLGLTQSFFHEEIALGALSCGKMVHTPSNNLWKRSTASQVLSCKLQPENWVRKTRDRWPGFNLGTYPLLPS